MNATEHLMVCGGEEANEVATAALSVAKALSKVLRFGVNDLNPERGVTAVQHLVAELNDLQGVVELLQEAGVELLGLHDRGAIDAKKRKVRKYMGISQDNGMLDGAMPAAPAETMKWPVARSVARQGDMGPPGEQQLRVMLDGDNDACVTVEQVRHGRLHAATVEFCNGGAGGGRSLRTRKALIELMCAIEADNAQTPALAWPPADEGLGEQVSRVE